MTGVEQDSLPTAVAHGSVGRESGRNAAFLGNERIIGMTNKKLV